MKRKNVILLIASILILSPLVIYNIKCNSEFFKVPISSIITIIIALVFTYYFSQKKNDERKKKDAIYNCLEKMQELLSKKELIEIKNEDDQKENSMTIRNLRNRIDCLKGIVLNDSFNKGIEEIDKNLNEYKTFIGDYISDIEYLIKSRTQLLRYINLIDSKTQELILNLYK